MLVVYLALVPVVWFLGVLISILVFKYRAGVSSGLSRGVGCSWFLVNTGKAIFWPAVLVYWLAKGRPDPKVVPRSQQF